MVPPEFRPITDPPMANGPPDPDPEPDPEPEPEPDPEPEPEPLPEPEVEPEEPPGTPLQAAISSDRDAIRQSWESWIERFMVFLNSFIPSET